MPRQIYRVHSTSDFEKSFRKLPAIIQDLAEKKHKLFHIDAFDPCLHTHKLKGELEGFWAYSVNYQYRIMFKFIDDNTVLYYDIGTHDIYR